MFMSPRSISFFIVVLATACSSEEPEVPHGGQSGSDSSGDSPGECETDGNESDAPLEDTIETLDTSPSALADALRGSYSVPCVGGDNVSCGAIGALAIDVEALQSATVEHGTMRYYEGEASLNEPGEACVALRLHANVRIRTEGGTLDLTGTELHTINSSYAAVDETAESTLFGETEDVDVHLRFTGITDTPRAISVMIVNAREGRALFSQEFGSGAAGAPGE